MRVPVAGLLLAALLGPALAAAGPTATSAQEPAQELAQDSPVDPPSMPEVPHQFSIALTASGHVWEDGVFSGSEVDDRVAVGFEVERRVLDYLAFRVGVGYAAPDVSSSSRTVSVDQYTVELLAVGRLPLETLEGVGIIPLANVGYGSLVHAPDDDDLRGRNQSLVSWGGGVEWSALERFGVRAEWRRTTVDRLPVFDPTDRSAEKQHLERWVVGVYWRF